MAAIGQMRQAAAKLLIIPLNPCSLMPHDLYKYPAIDASTFKTALEDFLKKSS